MYFSKYVYYKRIDHERHLFFNMLNNAVDLIENRNIDRSNFYNLSKYDREIVNLLIERGYIYGSLDEENSMISKLKDLYIRSTLEENYLHFYCGLTMECNLACTYCFEQMIEKKQNVMSKEMIDKMFLAIDNLSYIHKFISKRELTFYGGEPLLRKNLSTVDYIMKNIILRSMESNIITNGVDLNYFFSFIKENEDNISTISITLDGPKDVHDQRRLFSSGKGSFEIISNNINLYLLEKFSPTLIIRINIDLTNYLRVKDLIDYAIEMKWFEKAFQIQFYKVEDYPKIGIKNIISDEKLVSSLFEIINTYDKRIVDKIKIKIRGVEKLYDIFNTDRLTLPMFNYCNTSNLYVFDSKGKVYICPESIGDDTIAIGEYFPRFKLDKLELEIWQHSTVLDNPICSQCKFWPVCGGGCRYTNIKNGGGINKKICKNIELLIDKFTDDYIDHNLN